MSHTQLCPDADVTHLEARNGLLQFDLVRKLAKEAFLCGQFELTIEVLLSLHERATRDIYSDAGVFRDGPVHIQGTEHIPPPAIDVLEHTEQMIAYVNDNWHETPLHLCAYLMWRCNWIHPFFDGNGRTTRALSYLVFATRLGYEPGGTPTWVDMISANKFPYYDALDEADAAWTEGRIDVSAMEQLVSQNLAKQLVNVVKDAGGTQNE